jgi:hypothetical protein
MLEHHLRAKSKVIGVQAGFENAKWTEILFKEIITEYFTNLKNGIFRYKNVTYH